MITDYRIIERSEASILQIEVSRLMLEGWTPAGGVSVVTIPADPGEYPYSTFYQAMTYEIDATG